MSVVNGLLSAFKDNTEAEVRWTDGNLIFIYSACVIVGEDLAFWLLNGSVDFAFGFAFGSLSFGPSFYTRIVAYLLLIPVFLGLRFLYYLVMYPDDVKSGVCPIQPRQVLSLDWFAAGILATAFPLALQNFGALITSALIAGVGIFFLPLLFESEQQKDRVRIAGLLIALGVNISLIHLIPDAGLATYTLPDQLVNNMLQVTNSVVLGPIAVAIFGVILNILTTSEPIYQIPIVKWTNPERQPIIVVVVSTIVGTLFFLSVQSLMTETVVIFPDFLL